MSDRSKKIIFAIVFSIVSIGIGVALYLFFIKPLTAPTTPEQLPTQPTPGAALPSAGPADQLPTGATPGQPGVLPTGAPAPGAATVPTGPSNVALLRDGVTQAVVPTSDNQGARFYNPEDGRFYRVNPDGSIAGIGDKQFFNVDTVTWSTTDNQALLEFPDGSNILYDFDRKRQTTLPKHWEDFDFSPDGSRVVGKSVALDQSSRFLFVSNPDGNEAKAIEPLGANANRVIVNWSPNGRVIAFSKTGVAQPDGAEEIYLVGENHENFKSLIVPGRGFVPSWSPTGKQILYSVYHERDGLRPSLWVSGGVGDTIGENRRSLNIQTWADKCAWRSEDELICAVPQSLDTGAGLAPDRFRNVPDNLYRVDLRTGISTQINNADQTYPVAHPVLTDGGKKLIFTHSVTGQLYEYTLP